LSIGRAGINLAYLAVSLAVSLIAKRLLVSPQLWKTVSLDTEAQHGPLAPTLTSQPALL